MSFQVIFSAQNRLTLGLALTLFSISYKTSIWSVIVNGNQSAERRLRDVFYAYNWSTTFYPVAYFFGALTAWPASLRFSRRQVLLAALAGLFVGGLIVFSAGGNAQLIAGHVISGFFAGGTYVTAILWQAEVAQAYDRGRRVVVLFIAGWTGSAFGSWMQYAFTQNYDGYNGSIRAPLGLQFIPLTFAGFVLILFAPDSWR